MEKICKRLIEDLFQWRFLAVKAVKITCLCFLKFSIKTLVLAQNRPQWRIYFKISTKCNHYGSGRYSVTLTFAWFLSWNGGNDKKLSTKWNRWIPESICDGQSSVGRTAQTKECCFKNPWFQRIHYEAKQVSRFSGFWI